MGEHTPGPWRARNWSDGTPIDICTVEHGAVIPTLVARVINCVEANARLIAAAPDMLAALEALCAGWDCTDSYCEECDGHAPKDDHGHITGPLRHGPGCIYGNAMAAIAKARGQEVTQ